MSDAATAVLFSRRPVITGVVANTSEPDPVSSVTAAARFAEDGVPSHVATPAPNEVIPVPPLATGKVPVTPGVTLADPLNETADVLAKLVWKVLAVVSVAAEPVVF